ncbi:MAG: M20/M25/M40 family metallo-hydrolase [Clostridia bacterium]|nr:M20/M25/M40 family metallo-hydrolase [Clostridia bacterium]
MKCKNLFEQIDFLESQYIKVWEDICNIESPTRDKQGVDNACAYLIQMAKERGWTIEVQENDVAGNVVCITMNGESDCEPVVVSGHMDTVHPVGSFGTPAVRMDDTYIYGPGVCDCKGGVVASFLAMDALRRIGFTKRPVMLILQTDEEVGSSLSNKETVRFMCDKAKNAIAFLNMEGHTPGEACVVRKGIVRFTFMVKGIAAHSSDCAKNGANAIAEAAYKLLKMEELKRDDGITCNVGLIQGGNTANSVPDSCSFTADVRFATQEQLQWVRKYAKEIAQKVLVSGTECTLTETSFRCAMEKSQKNLNLLDILNRICRQNGMQELTPSFRKGGSDAAYVTEAGIPCLDSLGVSGDYIHSPRERARKESLKEAAKRAAAVAFCI